MSRDGTDDILAYWISRGEEGLLKNVPATIHGVSLDLYKLYAVVVGKGGIRKLLLENRFDTVTEALGFNKAWKISSVNLSEARGELLDIYFRYLYDYERFQASGIDHGRKRDISSKLHPTASPKKKPRLELSSAPYVDLRKARNMNASETAALLGHKRSRSSHTGVMSNCKRLLLSLESSIPAESKCALHHLLTLSSNTEGEFIISQAPSVLDVLLRVLHNTELPAIFDEYKPSKNGNRVTWDSGSWYFDEWDNEERDLIERELHAHFVLTIVRNLSYVTANEQAIGLHRGWVEACGRLLRMLGSEAALMSLEILANVARHIPLGPDELTLTRELSHLAEQNPAQRKRRTMATLSVLLPALTSTLRERRRKAVLLALTVLSGIIQPSLATELAVRKYGASLIERLIELLFCPTHGPDALKTEETSENLLQHTKPLAPWMDPINDFSLAASSVVPAVTRGKPTEVVAPVDEFVDEEVRDLAIEVLDTLSTLGVAVQRMIAKVPNSVLLLTSLLSTSIGKAETPVLASQVLLRLVDHAELRFLFLRVEDELLALSGIQGEHSDAVAEVLRLMYAS